MNNHLEAPLALPSGKTPPVPSGYQAVFISVAVYTKYRKDKSLTFS
jgi:hypothetical protein